MKTRIYRTIRNRSYELTAKSEGKSLTIYGHIAKYDNSTAA